MLCLFTVVACLLSLTGTALAQGVADTAGAADPSWLDLARPVIDATLHKQPALAGALALVLAVALLRQLATGRTSKFWSMVKSDAGGTALTFFGALGTAVAAAMTAGTMPSWGLLWSAIGIAAAASGGYTAIRRLVAPALRWVEDKVPAPLRPMVTFVFNLVLYFFEKKPGAIAEAEKAGADAVKAKPAQGAEAVTGAPKKFP